MSTSCLSRRTIFPLPLSTTYARLITSRGTRVCLAQEVQLDSPMRCARVICEETISRRGFGKPKAGKVRPLSASNFYRNSRNFWRNPLTLSQLMVCPPPRVYMDASLSSNAQCIFAMISTMTLSLEVMPQAMMFVKRVYYCTPVAPPLSPETAAPNLFRSPPWLATKTQALSLLTKIIYPIPTTTT